MEAGAAWSVHACPLHIQYILIKRKWGEGTGGQVTEHAVFTLRAAGAHTLDRRARCSRDNASTVSHVSSTPRGARARGGDGAEGERMALPLPGAPPQGMRGWGTPIVFLALLLTCTPHPGDGHAWAGRRRLKVDSLFRRVTSGRVEGCGWFQTHYVSF